MMNENHLVIESRVHLASTLAEAAEIEHNLMCLYLYAMFSLKRTTAEGVNADELAAIDRWRKVILAVCLEEMTHLSLVSNLLSATGGTPHFGRPNFPVPPGMYPSSIVIELATFNLQTLEHFIYLERPKWIELEDSKDFAPAQTYQRVAPDNRLMPSSSDYQTVGLLYEAIEDGLKKLTAKLGEENLFCGRPDQQITPVDSPLPGLIAIMDLKSALVALNTIITQGEGAKTIEGSHFQRFTEIRTEYLELLKKNPKFEPGRMVARNPVMRKPIDEKNRVWVTEDVAARYMDLANAMYAFMLRTLSQAYAYEDRSREEKHTLLEISFSAMHAMAIVGETLTHLPVSTENQTCHAGMSFAMVRFMSPLSRENELQILGERLADFTRVLGELQSGLDSKKSERPLLEPCSMQLHKAASDIEKMKSKLDHLISARGPIKLQSLNPLVSKGEPAAAAADAPLNDREAPPEIIEGQGLRLIYDGKRCIHSRHCVTELPEVFKANTPGAWIFPDKASAEVLAAVIRECPSGALSYEAKEKCEPEPVPPVNLMRTWENGPYAFNANIKVDGKSCGYRTTLCRCGQSKRKPFCDHTHAEIGFVASGEPDTVDATALKTRDGVLDVQRTENGPYSVKGNVEICANTGRVVLRSGQVFLCRCGHSKSKPICDGTHATIGFKDHVQA